MKIEMMEGVSLGSPFNIRVLVVGPDDPSNPCENCGNPMFTHKLLAKIEIDWCINCNDENFLSNMSLGEFQGWCMKQMLDGKAIAVVTEESL